VAELRRKMAFNLDLAERSSLPVYFQIDDMNFVSAELADDPMMCEWVGFPEEGAEHGRVARYWFNWGVWICQPAVPCLAAPGLRDLAVSRLRQGVLEPLAERLGTWEAEGRLHLFAGMAIGWETHIDNMTPGEPIYHLDAATPPVFQAADPPITMEPWEMTQLGYAALHWKGWTADRLAAAAAERGVDERVILREVCFDVIQEYSAVLARTVHETGVPRSRIFTHIVPMDSVRPTTSTGCPEIRCAVNPWSTPGFTLSRATAPYDVAALLDKIRAAEPGLDRFVCAETYFLGQNTRRAFASFLDEMFGNGATHVVVWGMTDPPTSGYSGYPREGAVRAALEWLGHTRNPETGP
jgi:hypothetical protein